CHFFFLVLDAFCPIFPYVTLYLFFFFQAEDGIRDFHVTGVQTCALPISAVVAYGQILPRAVLEAPRLGCFNLHGSLLPRWRGARSEERRVGKEGRRRKP